MWKLVTKEKEMKKIAIVGSHGVGKSILSQHLMTYLHKNNLKAKLVSEIVRACPLPIHGGQTPETTLWIVAAQLKAELEACNEKVDYVICDRSAFDPLVYHCYFSLETLNQKLCDFTEDYLKTYDKLVLVRPSNKAIEADGFRDTNKMTQYEINDIFTSWIVGKCHIIESNEIFETDIDKLCEWILKQDKIS